jgi:hypothetical protein
MIAVIFAGAKTMCQNDLERKLLVLAEQNQQFLANVASELVWNQQMTPDDRERLDKLLGFGVYHAGLLRLELHRLSTTRLSD